MDYSREYVDEFRMCYIYCYNIIPKLVLSNTLHNDVSVEIKYWVKDFTDHSNHFTETIVIVPLPKAFRKDEPLTIRDDKVNDFFGGFVQGEITYTIAKIDKIIN